MNRVERLGKLRKLLHHTGGIIETRKKFQKIVYLLQESGEDFDQIYYYHNYGVFSQTLTSDIEYGCDWTFIEEIEDGSAQGYLYKLNESSDKEFWESVQTEFKDSSTKLIDKFVKEEPRLLEALSTIVYLKRNHCPAENIREKLKELKPTLVDFFDEAFTLAKEHYEIDA